MSMDYAIISTMVVPVAIGLFFFGLFVALVQYFIRYGINYYFKMKMLNDKKYE